MSPGLYPEGKSTGGGHQKPKAFTERRKPREGGEYEKEV